MATKICVNIGSGNGLLTDGTKPLPEPMLNKHQTCSLEFTREQFHNKCLWIFNPSHVFGDDTYDIASTSPTGLLH